MMINHASENLLEDFYLTLTKIILKLKLLEQEEIVCYGVTIPQSYTIKTIDNFGKISMKELSYELGVTVSTMTRIVDILARDEIVLRENNPDDRRSFLVELTAKGKELAVKLKECTKEYLNLLFKKISEKDRQKVIDALKILLSSIETNRSCCKIVSDKE